MLSKLIKFINAYLQQPDSSSFSVPRLSYLNGSITIKLTGVKGVILIVFLLFFGCRYVVSIWKLARPLGLTVTIIQLA